MSEEESVVESAVIEELSDQQKDSAADRTIIKYAGGSMAVGLVPIPLADIAALTGIQLKLVHSLSKIYGVEFNKNSGKAAIYSLLGGIAPVSMALPIAASMAKFVPVVGQLLSYSTMSVLGGGSTYAIGNVFKQHFASGGTFLTFNPDAVRDYFTEKFEEGKEITESMAEVKPKVATANVATAKS